MAILDVDQLRLFVTTSLDDAALQILLNATEAEIVAYAGATGAITEQIDGRYGHLILSRPAYTVTSITETVGTTVTKLAADDYRIRADGYYLERLNTGTNRRSRWHGLVTVTYTGSSQDDVRKLVQVDLIRLDISSDSNLRSQTIGDFSETFANDRPASVQRDEILERLNPEPAMRVVDGPLRSWAAW